LILSGTIWSALAINFISKPVSLATTFMETPSAITGIRMKSYTLNTLQFFSANICAGATVDIFHDAALQYLALVTVLVILPLFVPEL
jgi:hypothetical protein